MNRGNTEARMRMSMSAPVAGTNQLTRGIAATLARVSITAWTFAAAASAALNAEYAAAQQAGESFVISGVTVIDVAMGESRPDMSVVVTGDRIVQVAPRAAARAPAGARVLDAAGAYVIPGLWDMHVHATWPGVTDAFFPALIAHGVTGVRDTWGILELAKTLQDEVAAGRRVGPRTVVAGNLIDGSPPIWPSFVAESEARGRALVDSLKRAGAAFIKVYSRLEPAVFRAIADEAKRQGIEFSGHVPLRVSAAEASDAGMGTMEHLYGIMEGCSSREAEILAFQEKALPALARGDSTFLAPAMRRANRRKLLATEDEAKCAALLERLARNGTWIVPTLTVRRAIALRSDSSFRADPRIAYVPTAWRMGWVPAAPIPAEDVASERQVYARILELVGAMHRARVRILAGTDLLNPWIFPGSSLHDELELLVEAGLTPLAALQAATLNPARYLRREPDLGTVEAGKLADLVLLDGDPLADIGNVRKVRAVVANGRLFERSALDDLLARARGERPAGGQEP